MPQTIWDKIYEEYDKGGKAWASLGDSIQTSFLTFIKKTKFEKKSVLDLGCGNGKHLELLQQLDFKIAGIDSSPTAIEMARKLLGNDAELLTDNFYVATIPSDKYDLIISIVAIQHGTKSEIKNLIDKIHEALLPNGKIFITFPRTTSLKGWKTFNGSKEIAPGTYVPTSGPEKGLPHSFYEKDELVELFNKFEQLEVSGDDRGRWIVTAIKT